MIRQINFSPLAGRTVFLDPTYITPVKAAGFVNAQYVITSLRQQLTATGCLIQDTKDTAEIATDLDGRSMCIGRGTG